MNLKNVCAHLLVLEFFLSYGGVKSLEDNMNSLVNNDNNINENDENNNNKDSSSGGNNADNRDDAASRLAQVRTMHDFTALLRRNGHPINLDKWLSTHKNSDGKVVISAGGIDVAMSDDCSPRLSTAPIEMPLTQHNIVYYPQCTKIERCGGCCPSANLACQASQKEFVLLLVYKAQIPYPGATYLEFTGFDTARVEKHIACRVVCTLSDEACGPGQYLHRSACKCVCDMSNSICYPPKVWDEDDCMCKCQNVENCCHGSANCGFIFSHERCECVRISATTDHTQGNNPNRHNVNLPSQSSTVSVSTTPTTTTSTTTASTTTRHSRQPCRFCPGRLMAVMKRGRCVCVRCPTSC